ncbi:hypothetical protein KFL_005080120 [Klebsormidium nitens]|uniref:Uncharacterized protein n=1 Tax=Klebsormidium nitens TaxID=105231 RepID=A0A1Y1IFB0_KLENI|nr:hypothetical protein KFL_005080120 [Klebsormidium nitens]|eukprot:GAQ89303.1 hypothetical protein KFL_005080120 [Klebsormidium nitens]
MAPADALVRPSFVQRSLPRASPVGFTHRPGGQHSTPPFSIVALLSSWECQDQRSRCKAIAGISSSSFSGAQSREALVSGWTAQGLQERTHLVRQSPRCTKAKAKSKKKPSTGRPKPKPWPFEDLMMFWDVAFEKWSEDPERAKLIIDAATKGLAAYGRGAVLVRETVTARSVSSAGSGFGPQAQRQRLPDDEQQFDSVSFEVEYMPRWKMERPADADTQSEVPAGAPAVVSYENLRPLLGSMDCTRMLTLTHSDAAAGPTTTATAEDGSELQVEIVDPKEEEVSASESLGFEFTGEEPYKSEEGELVLLMAVIVDGQLAVGADVVRRVPLTADDDSSWRLVTRDELFM